MDLKKNFSGLALFAFCATTSLIAGLALALIFTCATAAFAGAGPASEQEQITPVPQTPAVIASKETPAGVALPSDKVFSGVVTDQHCGARHAMNSEMSSAECARMCVRNGSLYSLVNGDSRYALDGNVEELNRVAGQPTKVSGTLSGSTIRVISVVAEQ